MNCNPTLTAEEFKTVHNALCELRTIYGMLDGVVREPITDKMSAAIQSIEKGLRGAYDQDNEAFDRKWNHYRTVQEAQGFDTIWSLYEVEDLNGEHGFPADSFVVYSEHWGGETQHCAVYGRTWIDLWRAADQCIRNSGDTHHRFIEIFTLKNGNELHLTTGS